MRTDAVRDEVEPSTGTDTKITQDMIDAMRATCMQEITPRYFFNRYATFDTLRHWVEGLGDPNPLFHDEDYASRTRWRTLINHPTFYFSTAMFSSPMGLPGVHGLHSGTDWEFIKPLRSGDEVKAQECLFDIVEKPSSFAGRMFQQTWRSTYSNQRGETTAICYSHAMRTERDTAKDRGKYADVRAHRWDDADLAEIDATYERELTSVCRGSRTRYWDDVVVGEAIDPIVRGPLTVTDIIAFKTGWGWTPFCRTGWYAWDYRQRHPKAYPKDPLLNIPDVPERVHWEDRFAVAIGAPGPYDYGPQRISWTATAVTHWCGDDGWLKRLNVQVRRFNILGDATWVRGEVVDKEIVRDECLVHLAVRCVNQSGIDSLIGRATVVLPRRNVEHSVGIPD